jgi:hypothetical protein
MSLVSRLAVALHKIAAEVELFALGGPLRVSMGGIMLFVLRG